MNIPKISIVTPSFNQAEYLEQTILSILEQNYPNLEYIIIDGGSTDNSVKIIKKYSDRLAYWVSEPDNGLYDALQKGFMKSTGEIMGWLNSDDMLHRNSLYSVAEILSLNSVEWIQGQPNCYDEKGRTVEIAAHKHWSKYRYFMNDFKWIQQESTFWRRTLWNKAGGYISTHYKYAGDLELWNRFFQYEKLFAPICLIGGFRYRSKNQLSLSGIEKYLAEAYMVLNENKLNDLEFEVLNKIKKIDDKIKKLSKFKIFYSSNLRPNLSRERELLFDFPKNIYFDRIEQKFKLS